jgi:hypothetical protein
LNEALLREGDGSLGPTRIAECFSRCKHTRRVRKLCTPVRVERNALLNSAKPSPAHSENRGREVHQKDSPVHSPSLSARGAGERGRPEFFG